MKDREDGWTILNRASIASMVVIGDRFAYPMSKGAVLTMTYSIAKDYIDDGIRCDSVVPARIRISFVDQLVSGTGEGKVPGPF